MPRGKALFKMIVKRVRGSRKGTTYSRSFKSQADMAAYKARIAKRGLVPKSVQKKAGRDIKKTLKQMEKESGLSPREIKAQKVKLAKAQAHGDKVRAAQKRARKTFQNSLKEAKNRFKKYKGTPAQDELRVIQEKMMNLAVWKMRTVAPVEAFSRVLKRKGFTHAASQAMAKAKHMKKIGKR